MILGRPGGQAGADLVTSSGAGRLGSRRWQKPRSAGTELLLPPGGKGCRATQRTRASAFLGASCHGPCVPAVLPGRVGHSRRRGRRGRHERWNPQGRRSTHASGPTAPQLGARQHRLRLRGTDPGQGARDAALLWDAERGELRAPRAPARWPSRERVPRRAGAGFPGPEERGPGFRGFGRLSPPGRLRPAFCTRALSYPDQPTGNIQNCLDSQAMQPGTQGLQRCLHPTLSARGDVTVPVAGSRGLKSKAKGRTARRP